MNQDYEKDLWILQQHLDNESGLAPRTAKVMPGAEDTYESYGIPWGNCSNTPFRLYKHFAHEGGISTPLVAHWPAKIKHGNTLTH